jgi:hypothetical protein
MNDFCLDADRVEAYEGYGPTLFQLSDVKRDPEGPSLPFGFVRHQSVLPDIAMTRDPWMWWQ